MPPLVLGLSVDPVANDGARKGPGTAPRCTASAIAIISSPPGTAHYAH